jgi:hypothetical protein
VRTPTFFIVTVALGAAGFPASRFIDNAYALFSR